MIISHKFKFIFVKTGKTAGTSIEAYLSPICGADDILTPVRPPVDELKPRNFESYFNPVPELVATGGRSLRSTTRDLVRKQRFRQHIPAWQIRARISPAIWNSYYKFSVDRNPWDKTISHYYWMLKLKHGGNLTFDQYLENGVLCRNFPYYTDSSGKLLVDEVIKYESLEEGLKKTFGMLGVPFDGKLGIKAKGEAREDRRPYQEVYTPAQKAVVDRAFADEISMHGYTY